MTRRRQCFLVVAVAAIGFGSAATASAASPDPLTETPAVPLPENYEEIAKQQIAPTLRDPASARFEFRTTPYRMICKRGTFDPKSTTQIWMVDVWVNGTNGYGGYTGFQPYSMAIFQRAGDTMAQPYTAAGGGALTQYRLCKPT